MKNNYFMLMLLAVVCISISSCKKKDIDKDGSPGNSGITMKIDGVAWRSTITTLFAEPMEHSEIGEYYHVLVSGQRIDSEDSEEDVSALSLYIVIPKSKFNNPKGTYPLLKESVARLNEATAVFTDANPGGHSWYVSYNPANPGQSVGTVEITDFAIGIQTVAGQSTDVEGYTKLSGTFRMDLYAMREDPGPALKITEGRFNLTSGIGFDF